MQQFAGKVALVTGGTSGIGRATAEEFARRGARVVIAARRNDMGQAVEASIRAAGGEATFVACDVSKENEVRSLVDGTLDRYGRLDCASNNAAPTPVGKLLADVERSDYDYMIDPVLRGVYLCMKFEIPAMKAGGAIVNCSSYASMIGIPGWSMYSAAKAAVESLTRVAAHECAASNIRVNNVTLGLIATPMSEEVAGMLDQASVEAMNAHIAMQRQGRPEEVARPIVFLCSDDASYITGATLMVDGGYHLI